ncbi:MAG TPA: MYXO-CTERM sorting domain-containing protein [Polyangiaceae bacterium]|nr:MYXO-CTERM sorting domain-containing protein [Polyangiaceae bacterium]
MTATRALRAEPVLVKDLRPGFSTSVPGFPPVVANGILYFKTDDGVHGVELWQSDGTPAGTHLVKDVYPGESSGTANTNGNYLLAVGSQVYFAGTQVDTGTELWRTNGTEAGTVLIKDLQDLPSYRSSYPLALNELNGRVVFTSSESDGLSATALYVTDGTDAGTLRLLSTVRTASEESTSCALMANRLYCTLQTTLGSRTLYVTDGTVEGTKPVSSNTGTVPQGPIRAGNAVFFWASDAEHGLELWKTDGTESGTGLLKDCSPGPTNAIGSVFLGQQAAYNGGLLFMASNGQGSLLWRSDGTEAGTVPVGTNSVSASWITSRGADAFFVSYTSATGREIWKTDGTAAGTAIVKDINPGSSSGASDVVQDFLLVGQRLFFVGNDGSSGPEIWRTDGTAQSTIRLTNFETNYPREIRPRHLRYNGNSVLFFADAGEPGSKLWSLDPNSPAITPGGGTSGSGGSSTGGNAAGGVTGGSQGQGGTNTGGTANGGTANGGATKGGNAAGGTSLGGNGGTAPGGASDGNSAGAGGAEAGSNDPGGGEAGSADSGQTSGGAITPRSGGSGGALSAGANSRGGTTQTTGGTSQPGSSGGANSSSGPSGDSGSGCSCRTTSKGQSALPWLALLALGITRSQRRRRR